MSLSKKMLRIKQEFADKIIIEDDIEKQPNGNRGIYGFFIRRPGKEECAYIGRSEIVSTRIGAHLDKIIDGNHAATKLNTAFLDKESKIICKFLEPVEYQFDDFNKDAQRLASRECFWIDCYQKKNECLEQAPEGRRSKEFWEKEKAKRTNRNS